MKLYKVLSIVQLLLLLKAELFGNKKGGFAALKITIRQKVFTISAQAADITVILLCSFQCHNYMSENIFCIHFFIMTYYCRFEIENNDILQD